MDGNLAMANPQVNMTEAEMAELGDKHPKGTTKEQWDQYFMDARNHSARVKYLREFMISILAHAQEKGIESAYKKFNHELDMKLSMDAPNKPGYYRANND